VKLVLASRNENKARELREILPEWDVALLEAGDHPAEHGSTFYENARAKADFGRALASPDAWVVGEDSGLEVAGLGGRPGVRSARYGGPDASDADKIAKLLGELEGVTGEGRRARYVCELVCLSPDRDEVAARGTLEGTISHGPRGSGGFGYDPVVVPDGETATVAELGDAWKAAHSHRARAARALRDALRSRARAL
jgi:XTP/dITP diphosphohydrolase